MDHGAGGLMGGEDEHFRYLDVSRGLRGKDSGCGYVVARERSDALIDGVGPIGVAMEADTAEVGLHKSGLQQGDAQRSVGYVDAQSVGDGFDSGFRGAVYVAPGVGGVAGYAADVDDMPSAALYHCGYDFARHRQQAFDVGVDHRIPIVIVAFLLGIKAEGEAGVVDEDVDGFPFVGEGFEGSAAGVAVSDVEDEHVGIAAEFPALAMKLLYVAACEDEAIAGFKKVAGAGFSDSGGGAGDHCYRGHGGRWELMSQGILENLGSVND